MKSTQTSPIFLPLTETEEASLSGGEVAADMIKVSNGKSSPGRVNLQEYESTNGFAGSKDVNVLPVLDFPCLDFPYLETFRSV
ncbi:hypothetical protein IQ277_18540 [Nostocales cyanobacterium LEGE 12452]|nr:hypothetical protein [Nostocales cyanobacterium LEGE 12452]